MKNLSIRDVIVVAAAMVLLTVLFAKSRVYDAGVYVTVSDSLQALRQSEVRFGQLVLKARAGRLESYDPIAAAQKDLNGALAPFMAAGPLKLEADRTGIAGPLDDYRRRVNARMKEVERFKSANAILRNSLNYLPVLARELSSQLRIAYVADELAGEIDHYAVRVLNAYIDRRRLPGSPRRFGNIARQFPMLSDELSAFAAHAETIRKQHVAVDDTVDDILVDVDLDVPGKIYRAYLTRIAEDEETSQIYRWLLYGASVLLVGYILNILVRLHRSSLRLAEMNADLSSRAEEVRKLNGELRDEVASRIRAAEEMRRAKDEAEEANNVKTKFLANMSHELRTPLNSIIGFSEVMERESFGPLGHENYAGYARDIRESGIHLLDLINDVLDIAKIEAGKFEVDLVDNVDILDCIKRALRMVRPQAADVATAVESHPPGLRPILLGDQRRMTQVFVNLLHNAVKFTPAGGSIRVGLEIDRQEDLVIRVSDSGVGIAPEDIPKVLAPFGQVQNDWSRRHNGTGLGLPLAASLVEAHEGSFALESAPGEGTTVIMTFPAKRIVQEASGKQRVAAG